MKKRIRFYKEEDNRWYAFLPEWPGDKADLEMVGGADVLLDILAQGETSIDVTFSLDPFDNCSSLKLVEIHEEPGSGATYMLKYYKGIPFDLSVWLCNVTTFVFGMFPNTIYFS